MWQTVFQQLRKLFLKKKSLLRFLWRTFRASCNTVLGLYLIFQLAYLLLGLLSVRVSLPKRVLSLLDEEFSRVGIVYDADSLEIDASGIVYLNQSSFSIEGIPGRFFSADWVGVRFSLLGLVFGDANIKGIMVKEGRLLCPAIYSPTGTDEELLGQMSLDFKRSKSWWNIRHCVGLVLGVPTFARGLVDVDLLHRLDFLLSGTSSVDAVRFGEFYDKLVSWREQLELLQNPSLRFELSAATESHAYLKIIGTADGLETNKGLFSGPCVASCTLFSDLEHSAELSEPLRISMDNVVLPGKFSATKAWAVTSAVVNLDSFIATVDQPYAIFSQIKVGEDELSSAGIWADPALLPVLEGEVWGAQGASFFDAFVDWDLEEGIGKAAFRGSIAPEDLYTINAFSDWTSYLDGVYAPHLVHLSGEVSLASEHKLNYANIWVRSHAAQVWGQRVYYASGHIIADSREARIEDAYVVGSNWTGKGVYWQSWENLDYRFRMWGSLDPDFASPWMPEFWRNIWRPFRFKTEAPSVNMDLQGNWKSIEDLSFFSSFRANDFHYSGQYVPSAVGNVSVIYNYVLLNELDIRGRQGRCTGWVDWLYVESEDGPIIVQAELDSTLPLEYYRIFEYARSTAEQFESEIPPHLLISGRFASETYFSDDRTEYTVTGDTQHVVRFLDIPLDTLQFKAHKKSGVLRVSPLSFIFANGKGAGDIAWAPKEKSLAFDMRIDRADRDLVLSSLPYFESFKDPLGKEGSGDSKPGFLTLSIDATGNPEDIGSFVGKGKVLLEEEDLGRVNLLGSMSEFLNAILIIPITSMTLNCAESSFTLEDNVIYFPDGIISGPTARITARGSYLIPDQWVDVRLKLYPLSKVPILGQAMLVLAPLSEVFSLHLEGPVSELKWSFANGSSKRDSRKRSHFVRSGK